jgi:hypothetical protein
MPKLKRGQRAELIKDIREDNITDKQICLKYGLNKRQIQYYREEVGLSRPTGAPKKESPVIKVEKEIEEEEGYHETKQEEEDEPFELDKDDLIGKRQEETSEEAACGYCHRQGETIILTEEMTKCPNCGRVLEWQR